MIEMNRQQQIEQPPTYMPPPQNYMPPPPPAQNQNNNNSHEKLAGRKFKTAFLATVAFVVLSNPVSYKIMNQVFLAFTGRLNEIVSEVGFPTTKGMFLHAFVFFIATFILLQQM